VVSGTVLRGTLYSSSANESQMALVSPLRSLNSSVSSSHVCTDSEQARVDATYVVGPDAKGLWSPVSILSIKYKDVSVPHAEAGQTATFCLQVHDAKTKLRRGMVLREALANGGSHRVLAPATCPDSSGVLGAVAWELDVQLCPILHSESIVASSSGEAMDASRMRVSVGTTGTLHCVAVKQAARVLAVEEDGCYLKLHLRFVHAAEFVRIGTRCVFRDGSAGVEQVGLAVGHVTKLRHCETECISDPSCSVSEA